MRKKILLVDDEVNLLELGVLRLEEEGYEVITETDGEKVLDVLKKVKPDLMILDLHLPKMSGYDIFDRMQNHTALAKIPVIFTSADANVGRIEAPFQGHVVGHLEKPWDGPTMAREIKKLLSFKPS